MARDGLTVKVKITGARETLAAFRHLPDDANRELRTATLKIADSLATQIRGAATGSSAQSALVAPTVKAKRDRVPVIEAGGSKKVGTNKKPAHKILFGANFGATVLRQFRPHRGAGDNDYWFFHTVESQEARIDREWNEVADKIIARWAD